MRAGRAAEAVVLAQAAVAGDPADREAAAIVAEASAILLAGDQRLAMLELTAAMKPTEDAPQFDLADAYLELDRPADAERVLKAVLARRPDHAVAHQSLGQAYLSVAMHDAADYYSRRAVELDPGLAIARQTLASVAEARGDLAGAREHLEHAYRRQSLYPQPARDPELTLLVLVTSGAGNIPLTHLLPRGRYSTFVWYVEFARADEVPPAVDLVLNAMGDADVVPPIPEIVRRFLDACGALLLNPPDRVALTGRHEIAERLAGIEGLVVPAVMRLGAPPERPTDWSRHMLGAGMTLPALVRPAGSHGGRGLVKVFDKAGLVSAAAEIEEAAYVTTFYDFASADGFYRKYRMIFVGGEPMPYHLAISKNWLVHHETSGMEEDSARQAEELAFLADPRRALGERAYAAIEAVGRRLGLDYCGIDFSLLPDGRVLVFEANATMLVHPEPAGGPFAAKNPYVEAILQRFRGLLKARSGKV
ncbi:tetratricopeptide repeat protein [Phenylobacterium montanum]|uniref:Tetratricopeptide repeat protein n=1 Tax=Phenylobacterium montanum TaxID=2823693 RepID=A0A975G2N3_9CAUL|nr:tetratricopeptide repeat protein [Caulobacter sp. S6]QUD90013.1 tetratricopeptide repeat protein [Caulobacter sp. S6]